MDPVTHLAAGALVGQAVRGASGGRAVLAGMVVAAALPDLDNLASLGGPGFFLLHHRGFTHSLPAGALIALGLAALLRLAHPRLSLAKWFLLCLAALAGHIFLDLATSYGTQLWYPFSNQRYSLPCLFIIDPFLTLPFIAMLLWSARRPDGRRLAAILGLSWMILYPALNLGVLRMLEIRLDHRLAREGVSPGRGDLTPDAFAPFFWKLVLDEGKVLRMAPVALLDREGPAGFLAFRKADPDLLDRLGREEPLFSTWAWFAVHPVMEETVTATGRRVRFGDLRFLHAVPFGGEWLRREEVVPFQLTALLDPSGSLTGWEYTVRGSRVTGHPE